MLYDLWMRYHLPMHSTVCTCGILRLRNRPLCGWSGLITYVSCSMNSKPNIDVLFHACGRGLTSFGQTARGPLYSQTVVLLVMSDALTLPTGLAGSSHYFPDHTADIKQLHAHFPPMTFRSYLQHQNSLWTLHITCAK